MEALPRETTVDALGKRPREDTLTEGHPAESHPPPERAVRSVADDRPAATERTLPDGPARSRRRRAGAL
ncbi:hypothetical protein [Streptomyces sp. NPDC094468]|uniref:hypothetical protein n=1 Tax=Streptomyces sp. NPDC094468 TaxID=3366066 RepID=UPI003824A945